METHDILRFTNFTTEKLTDLNNSLRRTEYRLMIKIILPARCCSRDLSRLHFGGILLPKVWIPP